MYSCPFSLPVFSERGPASSRPLNARDERWRFGALAVRITPTPTSTLTAVQAGVCFLLHTVINAHQPSARHSPLAELWPGVHPTRDLSQESYGKIRRTIDL